MNRNELISPSFRYDFREYCSDKLVIKQIEHCFSSAGITKKEVPPSAIVSGQRRTLVQQYYEALKWDQLIDIEKFLQAVWFAYQLYYSDSGESRKRLKELVEREGYVIGVREIRKAESQRIVTIANTETLSILNQELIDLNQISPQKRGFDFERFLNKMFDTYGMEPKKSFRLQGEQIDGSFQLDGETYLVEAKWQAPLTSQKDLLVFREKVESKSAWTRGLFISYSGYEPKSLSAFARGRATNIIGMDGRDLYYILAGKMSLPDAILKKARYAAETGEFYISVFDL